MNITQNWTYTNKYPKGAPIFFVNRKRVLPMKIRLYFQPKKVRRVPVQLRNAKFHWLAERSRERYDKSPEGVHTNGLKGLFVECEIGRYQGIRFLP